MGTKRHIAIIIRVVEVFVRILRTILFIRTLDPADKRSVKKILIVRLDHIGDVVMTTPAFRALRIAYPAAEIHLLCSSVSSKLLTGNPYLHNIHTFNWPWPYDKKDNTFTFTHVRRYIVLFKTLYRERYSIMIELRGDIRFHLLFGLLLRIPVRVSSLRTGGSSLLTHSARYNREHHELERTVDILESIAVPVEKQRAELFLSEQDVKEASTLLREVQAGSSQKYAVLCPTAAKNIKEWMPIRWSETAQYIRQRYSLSVLITGGPDDAQACSEIAQFGGEGIFSIAGKTTLKEIAAILKGAEIVLGVDGGTLHIASAFDVPIIAIFGPTRQEEFKPYSPLTHVIDLDRCECDKDIHLNCSVPHGKTAKCLALIEVKIVNDLIDEIFNQSKAHR